MAYMLKLLDLAVLHDIYKYEWRSSSEQTNELTSFWMTWGHNKTIFRYIKLHLCSWLYSVVGKSWHTSNLFVLGLQRGYSEDAVEADELIMNGPSPDSPPSKLKHKPSRPPRRGSLSRNTTYDKMDNMQLNGTLEPGT